MSTVDKFASLFAGNPLAYGTETGGVDRDPHGQPRLHLTGEKPCGVYPLRAFPEYETEEIDSAVVAWSWMVTWGCIDFDVKSDHHKEFDAETEDEAHAMAVQLQTTLDLFGVTSWIERTRSCGRHVWVFADTWVPAATMRRALLVAAQVADVSCREVNPKSEGFANPSALGNYVRLPYPGTVQTDGGHTYPAPTRCMLFGGADWRACEPWKLENFLDVALDNRCNERTLRDMARHYVPPAEPAVVSDIKEYDGSLRVLTKYLDGPAFVVFRDGPTTGDRSGGLTYLAHGCARANLPVDGAFALLIDADARWGKFSERPDRDAQLRRMIARAYG